MTLQIDHREQLFTSESVTEGHPDKMADAISDTVLDAVLAEDPQARVACETLITTGMVVLAGEITSTARPDYTQIVRDTVNLIGYDDGRYSFDGHSSGARGAGQTVPGHRARRRPGAGASRAAVGGRAGPRRRRRPGHDVRLCHRRDARADADAAGLARRAEVQVAYAIGVARPVSLLVDTFGTERVGRDLIDTLVAEHFDLRPAAIRDQLDLHRPIYAPTTAYGHFGRTDVDLPWERTDRVPALRAAAGLAGPSPVAAPISV